MVSCYAPPMLTKRNKWRANHATRASKRLEEIEASIVVLTDNDLLDFADIFVGQLQTPLGDLALAEMTKRNINL